MDADVSMRRKASIVGMLGFLEGLVPGSVGALMDRYSGRGRKDPVPEAIQTQKIEAARQKRERKARASRLPRFIRADVTGPCQGQHADIEILDDIPFPDDDPQCATCEIGPDGLRCPDDADCSGCPSAPPEWRKLPSE